MQEGWKMCTQHSNQILQQRSWITVLDNNRKGADVYDVVLADELLGNVAEDIEGLESDVSG